MQNEGSAIKAGRETDHHRWGQHRWRIRDEEVDVHSKREKVRREHRTRKRDRERKTSEVTSQ